MFISLVNLVKSICYDKGRNSVITFSKVPKIPKVQILCYSGKQHTEKEKIGLVGKKLVALSRIYSALKTLTLSPINSNRNFVYTSR